MHEPRGTHASGEQVEADTVVGSWCVSVVVCLSVWLSGCERLVGAAVKLNSARCRLWLWGCCVCRFAFELEPHAVRLPVVDTLVGGAVDVLCAPHALSGMSCLTLVRKVWVAWVVWAPSGLLVQRSVTHEGGAQ